MSDNGKPDIVPIDAKRKELEDASHAIAESLQAAIPEDCRYALFIYRPDGSSKYISSGQLTDVDNVITRWRAKVFGRPERVVDRPPAPKPGDLKYSNFFGCNVRLVKYESDRVWWFERVGKSGVARAQTPWSQMPPERNPPAADPG